MSSGLRRLRLIAILCVRIELRAKKPDLPSSSRSCRTVVRGGERSEASGISSMPTTLISPGTDSPLPISSVYTPDAITSLPQMMAVAPLFKKLSIYDWIILIVDKELA